VAPAAFYVVQRAGHDLCFACWATYANVRRATELDFDPFELVLAGTLLEVRVLAFEIPTGVVADVFGRRRSVLIGHATIGAGLACAGARGFALAGSFGAGLASWWLAAVARKTIGSLSTAWANQQLDSRVRATVLSTLDQASSTGEVAGGLAVGAIGRGIGVRAALLTASGLTLPALALFARAGRRRSAEERAS
jgi:DHA3 family tetracycline resistance protein-like MFS transporter